MCGSWQGISLMGKFKAPQVSATQASSAFGPIKRYRYNLGGFGSATAGKSKGTLRTRFKFSKPLLDQLDASNQGIGGALSYLNQTPESQLSSLASGNNAFYNAQAELNRLKNEEAFNQMQARLSQRGLADSSIYGGFAAQLARDATLLDLQTRQAALDYLNNQAIQRGQYAAGVQNQLFNMANPMAQQANANQFQGMQNRDQMAMFNAQAANNAALANAQMQQQANQAKSSFFGNLIGAGMGLATLPFTGGTGFGLGRAVSPDAMKVFNSTGPIRLGSSGFPFVG